MAAIDTGDVGRIERLVDGGGDVNVKGNWVSYIVAQPILVASLTGQTVGVGWKESGKVLH